MAKTGRQYFQVFPGVEQSCHRETATPQKPEFFGMNVIYIILSIFLRKKQVTGVTNCFWLNNTHMDNSSLYG